MSRPSESRSRQGFTILELIVALMIGSVLTGMVMRPFGDVSREASIRSAREVFAGLVGKARARAIERGTTVELRAFTSGDSVALWQDGAHWTTHQFQDVDLHSAVGNLTLCMNARGFGDTDCNSFSTAAVISFVVGPSADTLTVLPLGQVIR